MPRLWCYWRRLLRANTEGSAARGEIGKSPSAWSGCGALAESKVKSLGATVIGVSSESVSPSESVPAQSASVVTSFEVHLKLN